MPLTLVTGGTRGIGAATAHRLAADGHDLVLGYHRDDAAAAETAAAVRVLGTGYGGDGGVIVNVSSGAATLGSPGEYVHYAAAKAGVDALTKGLGIEVAAQGIRVVAVAPGLTDTDLHATTGDPGRVERMAPGVPLGRAGRPEEVADAIAYLLSDAASYVTATTLRVSGGR